MADKVLGGRYTVQDKIGIGGMATVYRGLDNVLGRTVAIKTMLPQYAADPSFAARFKQEAQAAAALQSPYIVGVYDWGKDNDTYYIIMEYLRGTDLKSGIRKHGALDCRKVAQIGSQICQALSVAHKHDIIHRDIKPQNIMVQPDGNIKVMDFGIARAKNSHLTADNSVLGTAHYVSPEQTQGKELGPTSDLYSLGIVMYEAATGKVPFDGDDAIAVALKQVNEQPVPPSQRNPQIDATLEGIILKCMQKNPADRFQTADELRRVLNDYLAGRIVNLGKATSLISATPTSQMNRASHTQTMSRSGATPLKTGAPQHTMSQVPEKKPLSKGKIAALVVAALVALGLIIWGVTTFVLKPADQQIVPNLSGLTEPQSRAQIKATNGFFDVGTVTEDYDDNIEQGKLKSQDPAYDGVTKQSKGTKINLVFSKGKKPAAKVAVPDLSGKTAEEAYNVLKSANLTGQLMGSEESSTVDEGRVLRQATKAGTSVDEGTTIQFWTSSGVGKADAGDHTGESLDKALSALKSAGFSTDNITVEKEYSDSTAENVVISQAPTGTQSKSTTIKLTVSKGSKPTPKTPAPSTPPAATSPSNAGNKGSNSNADANAENNGSGSNSSANNNQGQNTNQGQGANASDGGTSKPSGA